MITVCKTKHHEKILSSTSIKTKRDKFAPKAATWEPRDLPAPPTSRYAHSAQGRWAEEREAARTKPSPAGLGSEPRSWDSLHHGSLSRSPCFSFKYQLTGQGKVQLLRYNAVPLSLAKPRSPCPAARVCSRARCTPGFERKALRCEASRRTVGRKKKKKTLENFP